MKGIYIDQDSQGFFNIMGLKLSELQALASSAALGAGESDAIYNRLQPLLHEFVRAINDASREVQTVNERLTAMLEGVRKNHQKKEESL